MLDTGAVEAMGEGTSSPVPYRHGPPPPSHEYADSWCGFDPSRSVWWHVYGCVVRVMSTWDLLGVEWDVAGSLYAVVSARSDL